jgi:choline transport protein
VGSQWLSRMHPRFGVPVWALLVNTVIVFILGCLYLASATAFNAIISVGVILQQISFAFPAALLLWRRRSSKYLPMGRSFTLGIFGWVANSLTVVLGIVSLIFYDFPTIMPVTAGNMSKSCFTNYSRLMLMLTRLCLRSAWCHGNFYGC